MKFVWFHTFYHWSREGFRNGVLARCPLQGVGSHWDEWYRHEASDQDREEIEQLGRDETEQREFVHWLFRYWSRETTWQGNRLIPRFIVGQLAQLPPFDQWVVFRKYRDSYGPPGISAVILAEEGRGNAGDVRPVEGILLPARRGASGAKLEAEGFVPDGGELQDANKAAINLLTGPGFLVFVSLWIATGRRPGLGWQHGLAALGWLGLGAGLVQLLAGPDLHGSLPAFCAVMMAGWGMLCLHALGLVAWSCWHAWRQGGVWAEQLARSQLRLRMNGGLRLQGASAGLAFCLNMLLAIYRAEPRPGRCAWLWRHSLGRLHYRARSWAATGVLTSEGWLQSVVLDPKLRACAQQDRVSQLLTPRQRSARPQVLEQLVGTLPTAGAERPVLVPPAGPVRFGYAAAPRTLGIHRCRHLAQVLMQVGGLTSRGQVAVNLCALAVSAVMVGALPDFARILRPPPVPEVVMPGSPSPYHLWVSLDTRHPQSFRVRLESEFWANRVAEVRHVGAGDLPPRAEINMNRLPDHVSRDEDNGTVWIERRRTFLHREFLLGERVGRYPLSYVARLNHE